MCFLFGSGLAAGMSGTLIGKVGSGEMLVSCKKVFLMDEPTTGLDASTAHAIVRSMQDFAHLDQVLALCLTCGVDLGNRQGWNFAWSI